MSICKNNQNNQNNQNNKNNKNYCSQPSPLYRVTPYTEVSVTKDVRNVDAKRDMLNCANLLGKGTAVGGLPANGDFIGNDKGESGSSFEHAGPAYHFGVHARGRYPGCDFDDVESEMASDWAASRGVSILSWEWAKHAARDAWNRISQSSGVCA